jgi:hypothetical protein
MPRQRAPAQRTSEDSDPEEEEGDVSNDDALQFPDESASVETFRKVRSLLYIMLP